MQVNRIVTLNKPDCEYSAFCGNEARFVVDGVPMCGRCAHEATYVHPEDEDYVPTGA